MNEEWFETAKDVLCRQMLAGVCVLAAKVKEEYVWMCEGASVCV